MTDIVLTGTNTTTQSLNSLDSLFLTQGASLTVDGADAIDTATSIATSIDLYILGALLSTEAAIDLTSTSAAGFGNHSVFVGSTGTVTSGVGNNGVTVAGNLSSVQNFGQIFGSGGVAMYSGTGQFLKNSGSVIAEGTGVAITSTDAVFENSGQVSSGQYAVYVGVTQLTFINHGSVVGKSNAVLAPSSGAVVKITNGGDGTLSSLGSVAIDLHDGSDFIANNGQIVGDIELGGGADTFKGRDGQVFGLVLGEDGNDMLIGSKVDDDDLRGGADNDTIKGRDGDDNLDGGSGKDHLYAGRGDDELTGGTEKDFFHFGRNQGDNEIMDFEDGTDKIDLKKFGFTDKNQALGKFFEIGNNHNDKVGFDYKGTSIFIRGADLGDISKADIII